ncbi:MAG: DUF3883 domain-containing protein [Candidatus Brocadia sp.]|nr:DUF3883 domain-containing protein [Candidatus Brocadia sp.]UJS18024.1 MAG: DUF3883 domain-containing protein [Candidatus Jettenia sp.]
MREQYTVGACPKEDYPERIKRLRANLGLTQQTLAEHLGVSFATVNRWENGQAKPSQLSWNQLRQLEKSISQESNPYDRQVTRSKEIPLDFTGNPETVKILAEGKRLSFGHLVNPTFATEISCIHPLPHQRIAVYDHMLKQSRLRFLLADDAGAGKTIMTGLYIREMLSRRLLRRILIITPAGLVGNWRRELMTLFSLHFRIISGSDARNENPFIGEDSNRIIVSMDTLSSQRMFTRLKESGVIPYDLAVFDEAHKLSADRGTDLRVRKTDRYRLAESLAGIPGLPACRNGDVSKDERWSLTWSVQHLLLLTATPHMGKDYPYYALWRLLEPDGLSTPEAFNEFNIEQRRMHFIRRTKEEMIFLDGRPLYPKRVSNTLAYELSQGEVSEQTLYNETTDYLRFVYNKAKLLNREAARLAMSVFQRRLTSSTYALLRSFERRIEKLDTLIKDVQDGKISAEHLVTMQRRITDDDDILDSKAADDENPEEGYEENELAEEKILQGVIAASLTDLLAEKEQVNQLLILAKKVYGTGMESKFERLREILTDPKFKGEKFIIFTEHRDTLEFLVKRLTGLGYTDQVAQIHGGMHYTLREEEVERFKKPLDIEGARFLICTDAAGEGINLQFCWIMINYDVPWNPARLEQRMGRIHRYGQKHDPVIILNLVDPSTREGRVLKTLLDKLERIRKELQSDKVFDCIGRVFSGISIKQYMELAVTEDADTVARELDGRLTKEQIEALAAREKTLYGTGGDVAKELPRLRTSLEKEIYFRLLPGYVRQYIGKAATLVNIEIDGDMSKEFSLLPTKLDALDPLLPALEMYPEDARNRMTVLQPPDRDSCIWLHPGEPVFERFRQLVTERLSLESRRGAVFMDPSTDKPYLFHLALLSIVRNADPEIEEFAREEVLEYRLVGVKQYEGAEISLCPIEHLLLLKGGRGLPASAQGLAIIANTEKNHAHAFLIERVARKMALEYKKKLLESITDRENFIVRGFDFNEAELAAARSRQSEKARSGNRKVLETLDEIKQQQKHIAQRRAKALAVIRREPDLISPGSITFLAHAIVVPSSDSMDREQHNANVEMVAMKHVWAFEEAAGAKVIDVHTPDLARVAGLPDNPGFDLLSIRPGGEKRHIEIKGRAGTGDIEISANEWAKACNIRQSYWLYAVYDCATPAPRLARVQDPFGSLLVKAKGSFLISSKQVIETSEV